MSKDIRKLIEELETQGKKAKEESSHLSDIIDFRDKIILHHETLIEFAKEALLVMQFYKGRDGYANDWKPETMAKRFLEKWAKPETEGKE